MTSPLPFNGLGMSLGNLAQLSRAETRSISAENPTGAKGQGGMATEGPGARAAVELGRGWKIAPCIDLPPNSTVTLADIEGSGAIQRIWITVDPRAWRRVILRCYWDGEETPSVEVPLGDFFCNGWGERCNVNSLPISVNPAGGFNSYWEMPFHRQARITVENLTSEQVGGFFYTIDYTLTDVPADRATFHAQFRRNNPLPYMQDHTLLDGVRGWGHYVGTYIAWGSNNSGWWGEGEIKFYMDGDTEWPTICGTGTEDYFGGAGLRVPLQGQYGVYTTPFLGMPQVIKPDGVPEPAAVRPVPLAHHGPHPLRAGPPRHHPGARLAQAAGRPVALPAVAGRHRLDRALVSAGAARRSLRCRTRTGWK